MKKPILVTAVIMSLSTSAFAGTNYIEGFYVFGGIQNSELDADTSWISDVGLNVEDDDNGFNLGVGYKLNDHISFEFGYMDMNDVLKVGTGTLAVSSAGSATTGGDSISWTSTLAGSADLNAEADGWTLGVLFSTDITDKVDVFAKAGYYFWDATVSLNGTISAGSVTVNGTVYGVGTHSIGSLSEDGIDLFYGIGGSYDLTDDMAIRADYSRYEVWNEDVNVMGMSLIQSF